MLRTSRELALAPECYVDRVRETAADHLVVAAGVTTTNIDAVVERGGVVSGHVTNAGGARVAAALVEVSEANGAWAASARTDATGTRRWRAAPGDAG